MIEGERQLEGFAFDVPSGNIASSVEKFQVFARSYK
jgi:hypothetical protein